MSFQRSVETSGYDTARATIVRSVDAVPEGRHQNKAWLRKGPQELRQEGRPGRTATRLHGIVAGLRCSSLQQHKGASTRLTAHAIGNVSETTATDSGGGIQ